MCRNSVLLPLHWHSQRCQKPLRELGCKAEAAPTVSRSTHVSWQAHMSARDLWSFCLSFCPTRYSSKCLGRPNLVIYPQRTGTCFGEPPLQGTAVLRHPRLWKLGTGFPALCPRGSHHSQEGTRRSPAGAVQQDGQGWALCTGWQGYSGGRATCPVILSYALKRPEATPLPLALWPAAPPSCHRNCRLLGG